MFCMDYRYHTMKQVPSLTGYLTFIDNPIWHSSKLYPFWGVFLSINKTSMRQFGYYRLSTVFVYMFCIRVSFKKNTTYIQVFVKDFVCNSYEKYFKITVPLHTSISTRLAIHWCLDLCFIDEKKLSYILRHFIVYYIFFITPPFFCFPFENNE